MLTASQLLSTINSHLANLTYKRPPYQLYAPIEYALSLGGKRIRPVFLLMAYNLYKEDIEKALSVATGIEMYHNYTLLHDDLMDRSDLRRGKATVHKVWDDNAAILSGDTMLVLAYQYMADCPTEYLKSIIDLFSITALEICEGQQLDVEFENRNDVTEEEYLEMIRLKTAVLLAASFKIGAMMANASEFDKEALYNFGIEIGLAFQLQDDLLDVYGDSAQFGKRIGGDILCNKKTYLLITALKQANESQREELEKWLNATSYDELTKINSVTTIYNQIGVKELCESKIKEHYATALTYFAKLSVEKVKKQELIKTVESLMRRNV